MFLYEAGGGLTNRDPGIANETGRVDFWWNELATGPNMEPVADSPWARTVDVSRPGRFCVTIIETSGSSSDWTVTITDKP
jgi:hypothetical protein